MDGRRVKCDVCKDEVPDGPDSNYDEHNKANYVRHVFLSHRSDAERIRIIQSYIDVYTVPRRRG